MPAFTVPVCACRFSTLRTCGAGDAEAHANATDVREQAQADELQEEMAVKQQALDRPVYGCVSR